MKNKAILLITIALLCAFCRPLQAQDSTRYQLRLSVPLVDFPQNKDLPYRYPSMYQSLEFANDFYELAYFGIDKLGNSLFKPKRKPYTKSRKIVNHVFKYALTLGFSKYGSELPIPLGVWAHEDFHRAALGIGNINSKNGNWLTSRWDGTVYGVSDEQLTHLKNTNPDQLLYSYVAGMQSEVLLNRKISIEDFYKKRTLPKNALLLYNAYYVFDYFRFATSPQSDSVKVIAPKYEGSDPVDRDFAGADLTAWAYDMFNPDRPFTERDKFPNGQGVNRRVGFSDLSSEAQQFLKRQKKFSLLNFANPAIFFINRFQLGKHFSFNAFAQYAPTHFGNDIALFLPVQIRQNDLLFGFHQFSNFTSKGFAVDLGNYNRKIGNRFETDFVAHFWEQPEHFYGSSNIPGGAFEFRGRYRLVKHISASLNVTGKSKGWLMGSPYLKPNVSAGIGLNYQI